MSKDEKNKELKSLIAYYLTKSGYSKKELAIKLGISAASLYNKLKNPDSFTFGEIRLLFEWMGKDNLMAVI